MTPAEIRAMASEPFHPDEVKWKPQKVSGNRCMAICYVDARVVMDRLDDVFGPGGWQDEYTVLPDGKNVKCRLSVLIGSTWISHEDIGGESEQPDDGDRCKAAFSDSLKRAAVKLGIGRYLYRLGMQWVDYDPQKKQMTKRPTLPAWAIPKGCLLQQPANTEKPSDSKAKMKPPVVNVVRARETKLVAERLCDEGDLTAYLHKEFAGRYPGEIETWPQESGPEVAATCKVFEQQCIDRQPVTQNEIDELEAELKRTGTVWEKVRQAKHLSLDSKAQIKDLTLAGWRWIIQVLKDRDSAKAA